MKSLVCFAEEPSMMAMLEGLLPRLFPDIVYTCIPSDGKQDLENKIKRKLRSWNDPNAVFLVIRDQDSGDCKKIKARLMELCKEAGKPQTLIRIACHELESFYFGDLVAVETALNVSGISEQKTKAKYRIPDNIENPSNELEKITNGKYQKISGSKAIGLHLSLDQNTSHSFNALISGIRKIMG